MPTQDLPTAVGRLIEDCLNARSTDVMGELFDANYVHRWGLDGQLSLPDYIRVMGLWFSAFPDFHVEPEMSLTGNDLTCVRIVEDWEDYDFAGILSQLTE